MQSGGLKLITACAYLTDVSTQWRGDDHKSLKMVKALKGDVINGYFDHVIAGKTVRFDQTNIQEFVDRIPRALSKMILREVRGKASIVPIPNSHVVDVATPSWKTLALAKAVASESGGQLVAVPALVFKSVQVKSREGGPRSAQHFHDAYKIVHDISGPVVLLDDVCTGGGHIVGAYRKLLSAKRNLLLACAFGRSTKIQRDTPVGVYEEMLDLQML